MSGSIGFTAWRDRPQTSQLWVDFSLVFSFGLATVLTGLGLLLVYAKPLFKAVPSSLQWVKGLPTLGALSMTIVGLAMSIQALSTISGGG